MTFFYHLILGVEDIVSRVQSDDTLVAKLPCRLDLMNYKQCSEWIRNQILLNHKEQGKKGSKIGYSEDDWHPDFWLDDIFPWSSMRCNFNNLKASEYSGEKNMVWYMKRVISERLSQKGIYDPDQHVSMEMSEEEVIRKERRRGVHSRPSVLRHTDSANADAVNADAVNSDVVNSDAVNADAVNENSINEEDDDNAMNESNISSVDHNNSIHDVSFEDYIPHPTSPGLTSPPPTSSGLSGTPPTSSGPSGTPPTSSGPSGIPPNSSRLATPSRTSSLASSRPDSVETQTAEEGTRPRRKRPSQLVEYYDIQPPLPPRAPASPPPHLPSRSTPQPPPLPPRVGRALPSRQLPPRYPRSSVIQEPECLPPKRQRKPVTCSTCSSSNCSQHATASRPIDDFEPGNANPLRPLIVAGNLVSRFKELSMQNTIMKKETGGLLFGELINNKYVVDVLVIPKQIGGPDYWKTADEAELGKFSADNPRLTMLGTIHTHPGFDARPSSVDLHQQYDIQLQQPSAISVIVAPERNQSPFYTITPFGMTALRDCTADRTVDNGFHMHRSIRRLFTFASNVMVEPSLNLNEIDQRYETQFQNI